MTLRLEGAPKRVGAETRLQEVNLGRRPGNLYVLFGLTLADKISLTRLMPGWTGRARDACCGVVWDVDTGWRPGDFRLNSQPT
jgi:hypothetical protein